MLNLIFQKAKTEKEVYPDCRHFFSRNKKEEWFRDPVVKNIIKYIDNTEVIEGFVLRNELGETIPPEYLSTGTKATILIYEFEDKVFNLTQCGNNALKCVAEICKRYDRTCLTYRDFAIGLFDGVDLAKDGQPFSANDYDDLAEEWLEEIYND